MFCHFRDSDHQWWMTSHAVTSPVFLLSQGHLHLHGVQIWPGLQQNHWIVRTTGWLPIKNTTWEHHHQIHCIKRLKMRSRGVPEEEKQMEVCRAAPCACCCFLLGKHSFLAFLLKPFLLVLFGEASVPHSSSSFIIHVNCVRQLTCECWLEVIVVLLVPPGSHRWNVMATWLSVCPRSMWMWSGEPTGSWTQISPHATMPSHIEEHIWKTVHPEPQKNYPHRSTSPRTVEPWQSHVSDFQLNLCGPDSEQSSCILCDVHSTNECPVWRNSEIHTWCLKHFVLVLF